MEMIPITKPCLSSDEADAVKEVILSGWVAQGPRVKEFEESFAAYVGAPYACAVSNCTTALHLSLLAAGVKPGDAVITVSHSFITTTNVIRYCQAEPLFVDIDPDTYNISAEALSACLNENRDKSISAIIVVHQIGMPCDLKNILPLARQHNIPVIEDAACAAGSSVSFDDGRSWERIGRPHGDIACFSFHPRKLLTCGEGGMVTTRNARIDARIRLLRHQGMSVSDLKRHDARKIVIEEYPVIGYNYRMTDMQAAMGIVQLGKLSEMVARRRQIAALYKEALSGVSWLRLPVEPCWCQTNWQSFAIRLLEGAPKARDDFMQYLLDAGVATRPGIMNAHEEAPYSREGLKLPCSEAARQSVVLIPMYSLLTDEEIQKVIELIKNVK